jgi:hypothetical protein
LAEDDEINFICVPDLSPCPVCAGYNDVSWHNPDMPTPTLHGLAQEGVILEQAYSQQVLYSACPTAARESSLSKLLFPIFFFWIKITLKLLIIPE